MPTAASVLPMPGTLISWGYRLGAKPFGDRFFLRTHLQGDQIVQRQLFF